MARIIGMYARYVQEQKRRGKVKELSHENSVEIEMKISEAFIKAKNVAEIKQRNSVRLLRQLEALKGY